MEEQRFFFRASDFGSDLSDLHSLCSCSGILGSKHVGGSNASICFQLQKQKLQRVMADVSDPE